jgi:hypothetical protein
MTTNIFNTEIEKSTWKMATWIMLRAAVVTLVITMVAGTAIAQVAGGTLSGTVTDPKGAVVPNTSLQVRNVATGVARTVTTDGEGFYNVPNLVPGSYEVVISAQGFREVRESGIVLTVGAVQRFDIRLEIGSTAERVEVTAAPPAVDTGSSALTGHVDATTMRELPLNGRDWTQLATLEPGVVSQRAQASTTASNSRGNRGFGNQLSANGHRPYENTYRMNGININDYSNGAPGSVLGVNLGVDAIQEFTVLTSNYSAEYGRTSGAVINAVTKGGTNQLHGVAYFFDRDKIFDAKNYFDKAKPPFRRIQFGAAAGGPVIKDRTFIFGTYEGIRQSKGITQLSTVLSDAARTGSLSAASGGGVTVDPNVARYLVLMPRVNAGLNPGGDTGNFSFAGQSIINENYGSVRVDHKISNSDSIAGNYFFDSAPFNQQDPWNNFLTGSFTRRQGASIEETHIFGSELVNAFRFGYNRSVATVNRSATPITDASKDQSLAAVPSLYAPLINVPGITPTDAGGGLGSISSFNHVWNSFQLDDDLVLVHGKHSMKVGFAGEDMQYNLLGALRADGEFFFSSLSNFLTNRPRQVQLRDPNTSAETGSRQKLFAVYGQDDWRLRPNLTLNLGLRYEMVTLPSEANNRFQAVTNLYGGTVHPLKTLWASNPTKLNFEPRVGFAWDPFKNGATAVRGGFGIFDVLALPYTYTQYNASSYPFSNTASSSNAAALIGTLGTPKAFPLVSFNPNNLVSRYIEQDPHRSYAMNWNLNIQRQITSGLVATIGYVGSHSLHLPFTANDDNMVLPALTSAGFLWPKTTGTKVDPNAGSLRPLIFDSGATYHALQSQLKKAMANGVQLGASYTWSKCLDTGSTGTVGDVFLNSIRSLPFFSSAIRRGRCDFDIQHNFVANYVWQLPSPKLDSVVARSLAGGWELGGVVSASTGMPFTVMIGGDPLGLGNADPIDFPARLAASGCSSLVNPGSVNYLKTQCFGLPQATPSIAAQCAPFTGTGTSTNPQFPGTCSNLLGNVGRNALTGPGLFNTDFSVLKNNRIARISETFNVQFRAEFFNIFNRANFQAPLDNNKIFNANGTTISNAGQITALATEARQIQFGLRVIF